MSRDGVQRGRVLGLWRDAAETSRYRYGKIGTMWSARKPSNLARERTVRFWKRMQQYGKRECNQVLEGCHDRTIFSVAWGEEGKVCSLGLIFVSSQVGNGGRKREGLK